MKKIVAYILASCILIFSVTAQKHISIELDDNIYNMVENLQLRGIFPYLALAKPYSEDVILSEIKEILATTELREKLHKTEILMLEDALARFTRKKGIDWTRGFFGFGNYEKEKSPRMEIGVSIETSVSAGFREKNHVNFDLMPTIKLNGSLWDVMSFRFDVFGILLRTPLHELGTYNIGGWWYGDYPNKGDARTTSGRIIKSYANYASFPFAYKKKWDGSVYYVSNLSASGLEGWPVETSMSMGIFSELGADFFDNKLSLRIGRQYREWAGMQHGASLVLNAQARPFIGMEFSTTPFKHFSFSSMFGFLEMPKAPHITGDSSDPNAAFPGNDGGSKMFQNMFGINMLELNFKYVHVDFGTTVVFAKRFEMGYLFPLMSKLFYQNDIGDFDNIGLFGNIKLQYPKIGSLWFSLFLDETPGASGDAGTFGKDFFNATRNMYAFQFGTNFAIPFLPFTTLSLRYTKVEPYCYTHHSINYTPWTDNYISLAYANNGASLGYYLPPNSDELFLRFDVMPERHFITHVQYQMIRHGADYGSRAVAGSSIYSELPPGDRDSLRKYFLRDGAYQWFHIIKVGFEYSLRNFVKTPPMTIYADLGYVFSYFTDSGATLGKRGDINYINTSEYPTNHGVIISLGFKLFL